MCSNLQKTQSFIFGEFFLVEGSRASRHPPTAGVAPEIGGVALRALDEAPHRARPSSHARASRRARHLDEASPPRVGTLHAPSSRLPPPTHRSAARSHVSPPVHLEIFAENTVFELETGNFHTILPSCTAFKLH